MKNSKSRIENSLRNVSVGLISQIITIVLGLVVRTFFIRCLTAEYLGVNGLYTNILTMLSLAEMGIGTAIVFNMYKPLAENDHLQIAKLMNLYRQAYTVIGITVAIIGLCLTPFLDYIIKDKPDIPHLSFIYLLFLANTVSSYFFAYKRSLFSADQRERVIKMFYTGMVLFRSIIQICILIIWKDYIGFLVSQILCTFIENVCISIYANRCYPYLNQYNKVSLEKKEKKSIFDNIKSTFIYKFCTVILNGTDNIIISATKGVASVGLLSNYTLITGSVETFLCILNNSITGSIGNYIAKEPRENYEKLLINVSFVNFLVYGVVFVGSVAILNPFIMWWAGEEYLLSTAIVIVHSFNIYISGTMSSIWAFRSTMGLFKYGRWRPLFSAVINLVVSIWWGNAIGVIGVLLGTTFTRVVTNLWYDPLIVYKYGLCKKPLGYYWRWLSYFGVVFADAVLVIGIQYYISIEGLLAVLFYGGISVLIFGSSVVLLYHKCDEYDYVLSIIRRMLITRTR